MKKLINLNDVKTLKKSEQKLINGGNNPICHKGFCVNSGEPCGSSDDCEWEYPL